MKFATVTYRGALHFGLVQHEAIHLAPAGLTLKSHLRDLASTGADLRNAPAVPLSDVSFAPVIPDPEQIFCAGLNYQHHRDETRPEHRKAYPEHPVLFMRFASSLERPSGFSQRTWAPAAKAASACSAWNRFGVQMWTTSGFCSASRRSALS